MSKNLRPCIFDGQKVMMSNRLGEILYDHGITTFAQLREVKVERLMGMAGFGAGCREEVRALLLTHSGPPSDPNRIPTLMLFIVSPDGEKTCIGRVWCKTHGSIEKVDLIPWSRKWKLEAEVVT